MNAPVSSAAQALAYIKERLMSGAFAPGSRLTEEGLARDLGLSRTPVREAIRKLTADGFLTFKPNSGTFVAEWTDEDLRQIFDLRTQLEGRIAEAAAQAITPEEIARLAELQEGLDALANDRSADGLQRRSHLNREFHALVATASRSPRLAAALHRAIEMPVMQQTFRRYTAREARRSLAHHHEMIEALRQRDPVWARAVMTCHIRAGMSTLLDRPPPRARMR